MSMSKDEYEKIIMHGAAKIMAAKTESVTFEAAEIDLESLIAEGIEKNRLM